ncbi:MAG: bifunctional nuclease family protein [Acidobacteriota bacterium]
MLIKMKVKSLLIDPVSNMPIIILREESSEEILPIWVGIFEANAIAMQLEKIISPRPMTHDLLKNILDDFHVGLEKVVINDLKENTFFATLYLKHNNCSIEIDSRPSDAIALALRTNSPIFVESDVLHKAKNIDIRELSEADRLRKWLENVDPKELGKYEM